MSIGAACAERNLTEAHVESDSVHRFIPPLTWTTRSMRLNAASSRRWIWTGARCSSAAMMAICSARTIGGVPRFRRRPHACRPGRASRGCCAAHGRRVGEPLEPRRTAGRRRPRHPASLRRQVAGRGPAAAGAADRRRRELRCDARRAAVAARDTSAPAARGEYVRQRARPPARATSRHAWRSPR